MNLKAEQKFNEFKAKFYTAEIVLALEELHKNNIIFRDLKPENILIAQDCHIKLTDFGLSKEFVGDENQKTYSFCGTALYLAPEIIEGTGHYKAVDWWSLGILLYEMITGHTPFDSDCRIKLFHLIKNVK